MPGLMALAAVGLALGIYVADLTGFSGFLPGLQLSPFEDAAARELLSTITGATISVAGVVFSITILVLSISSTQFGPRLLRNFMAHFGTRLALGTFVAVFIYCLITLALIREKRVPQVSLLIGLCLGIASFLVLIYFIHHVTEFIHAPRILDDAAKRLKKSLGETFPERQENDNHSAGEEDPHLRLVPVESARIIYSPFNDYIEMIDLHRLIKLGQKHDVVIRLLRRSGHFIDAGSPLALVTPVESADDPLSDKILECFAHNHERTGTQDPEFTVEQLVQIALRALSPGINDPFTAMDCIDRLTGALVLLSERQLPPSLHRDSEERIRVITIPLTYEGIIEASFDQVRQNSRGNIAVSIRLLDSIASLAERSLPVAFRSALREQAKAIHEGNREIMMTSHDREDFEKRYRGALRVLEQRDGRKDRV